MRRFENPEGKGKGSSFIVTLPATLDQAAVPAKDVTVDAAPSTTIIHEAESMREARAILQDIVPDLIISDIGMPEENGYEFMSWLRSHKDHRSNKVPAIGLTAYARDEEKQLALNSGYQAHITKPVSVSLLISAAAELCRSPLG